jgi:hypothetical protein
MEKARLPSSKAQVSLQAHTPSAQSHVTPPRQTEVERNGQAGTGSVTSSQESTLRGDQDISAGKRAPHSSKEP